MASVEKKLGTETIHVLNDKYQFVSAQQAVNAKWLDLDNVVSVKRDKTIYAIRARTNYDFDNQDQNCEFFCNINGSTGLDTTQLVTSNIYRNFDGNTNNIFDRSDYSVYGNANINANLIHLGWAGSLDTQFTYQSSLSGNINVSSKVSVFSNLKQSDITFGAGAGNLSGYLNLSGNTKDWNVSKTNDNFKLISNAYSTNKLFISNAGQTKWNRLINANVNGNVIVTASTDPCDLDGKAIKLQGGSVLGNAESNEAYRHQFLVRRNAETVSNENPIYIGRISRFGTSLKDISGTMANVISIDSFTSNFFANLPADNLIYYDSSKELTEMSITGTYKSTDVAAFNGNYTDSNIGNMSGNLLSSITAFKDIVTLGKYDTGYSDYITNPNLTLENTAPGKLSTSDRFTVVQSNVNLANPLYLFDRLKVESENYKPASEIFAASTSDEVNNIVSDTIDLTPQKFAAVAAMKSSETTVVDSKVVQLSMYNIVANNWQSTLEISPNLVTPSLTGTPEMPEYTSGNTIQLFLRRGFIGLDNYSQINTTVQTTGSRYFSTIPSFLKSYSDPADGIYIEDKTVIPSTQANLSFSCNITSSYEVSDTISITANISPDLCFYVFANADVSNRVDRRANIVIPSTNSVIANIWTYSNVNGATNPASTVNFDPKIVYNNFDGLSVENPFAKKNMTYTVKFGKVLGETNLEQEKASNTLYGFNANLSNSTGQGNVVSALIANVDFKTDYMLTNNPHLNGLLLNGVAYSEYEFTDFSYKFTDLGNVMSLHTNNYKYNSVLPVVGNTAPGSAKLKEVKDNYMNILVDYAGLNIQGADADVHRLAVYDNHYRYYINSVQKTGGSPIDITTKYNSTNSDDVFALIPSSQGTVSTSPSITSEHISPSSFLVFTYEKIYENSSNDSFYPFTSPNDLWSDRVTNKVESDNYLFPGFVYKHSGEDVEFYNYKDETTCDFVINNNIKEFEQSLSLVVFSADSDTRTLKVGLSNENSTKSISVRPIRVGGGSTLELKQWYTPIVFKIAAESNSYVVLLIKILVNTSDVFIGLDSTYAAHTPLAVNINSIEKASDGSNQIQFKSKLQVYSSSSALLTEYTNIVNSHKTKLSNFSYSSEYGSSNTNVGVNLYSIPVNNIVILFAYTKDTIKQVMNYTQSDYELDNSVNYDNSSEASRYKKINRPIASLNFASSRVNPSNVSVPDGSNPWLAANTTRFYLDQGYGGAIYVDYQNNSVTSLKNMSKFQLSRSVEWILTRQEEGSNIVETVGRGLLSKNPSALTNITNTRDFIIGENLGKASSGFYMNVKTNIIDMASHLILQKKQTGAFKMNTPPQFKLKTKSDTISVSLFHENPSTLAKTFIMNKITDSRNVDLGKLFEFGSGLTTKNSKLPTFEFDLVRSLSSSNTNHENVSDALFRVRIRLDNYCVVHNKKSTNGSNVLFTSLTNVDTLILGLKMSSNLKRSLNYDFLNISGSFGTDHKLIKSFVHKGFGSVDMRVYDFTSHYDNELPSQELTSTVPSFNFPNSAAYKFSVPISWVSEPKQIEYDTTYGKYFVNLGSKDFPDKLYFKKTGLDSQPITLNDKETFLLYTGTRPVGFITYEMLSDSTLESFTDSIPATFKNTTNVLNCTPSSVSTAFNNTNPPGTTYKMYYSVAFTNRTSDKSIKVRGVSYKFKTDEVFRVSAKLNILFGVFRSLSGLLTNMKFNYNFGGVQGVYSLTTTYIGNRYLTSNFEENSDKYMTYDVSSPLEKNLFKLKIKGSVSDITLFKVIVNPSKLEIYQAMDANDNGELDNSTTGLKLEDNNNSSAGTGANSVSTLTSNFGLQTSFSELLYNLKSNPSNKLQYRQPALIHDFNLNYDWNSIPGSGLDIKLNNKWSIGYNLDCFFTIRNNNICTFDVISIDTDTQNTSASPVAASLKVQNSLPLIVGNKNSWARSKGYTDDSNDHCGLTFKLKEGQAIKAAEIVRIFVDNTPLSNTLQVNVNVAGKESKSYKLSDYDNETYSRLLDKQIKLKNKFE